MLTSATFPFLPASPASHRYGDLPTIARSVTVPPEGFVATRARAATAYLQPALRDPRAVAGSFFRV